MEDEDLGVGVRHLDHERVQQVIGVASLVQMALELGDVPEKDKADLNFPPIFFSILSSSLGRSKLLPSAESVEPGDVVDVALLHRLLCVCHILLDSDFASQK